MIATLSERESGATKLAVSETPDPNAVGIMHSVETCGTVDGPGIRYILFLSGCPLRCQYCHNPDAQGAPCGKEIKASEVIKDVVKYKNFIKKGGVTISGGEPLMQADFVKSVFYQARQEGIHTALDTSGFLGKRASDDLLDLTDLVLLDIKSGLPDTYKKVTGVDLQPTLDFAKRLSDMGKPVWIRFVLVPGLTNGIENMKAIAQFMSGLSNIERFEILPFHKMGEHKYKQLSIPYKLENTPTPTTSEIEEAKKVFADYCEMN